jgi:REP element-mobilizing transposase RayT
MEPAPCGNSKSGCPSPKVRKNRFWVIAEDHVHLLLTPLRDLDGNLYSLIEILQGIKSASAHSLNRALGRSGPVWQEESFDHVLRSEESFEQTVEYIRQNPVRRGLVTRPEDYRWLWVG